MNIIDSIKKKDMRIYILKRYIRDLQLILDENVIDYSELRKKYLFQYSFTEEHRTTELQRNNNKYTRRIAGSNKF